MGARYLGNKSRTVLQIRDALLAFRPKRVVDVFAGTGTVAQAIVRAGVPVLANDHLACAAVMTEAACVSTEDVRFLQWPGFTTQERYRRAIDELNAIEPHQGFLWREYSPSGYSASGQTRYYFTELNAARLDGIRRAIGSWRTAGLLSLTEHNLLLADAIHSTNDVANIAGTYGCFLQPWSQAALRPLRLVPRVLPDVAAPVEVMNCDYRDLPVTPEDVIYFDPPYTKRQYAAYYHIPETIAHGDEPDVGGVTGLRPWEHRASPYCYALRALREFSSYLESCRVRAMVMSYSSDGHMSHGEILDALGRRGTVEAAEFQLPRFSSNSRAGSRERVVERLYVCEFRQANERAEDDFEFAEVAG